MKKTVIGIVVAIIVIGVGAAAYFDVKGTFSQPDAKTTELLAKNDAFVSVSACDVLTEQIARQVLGNDITKATATSNAVNSDDMVVSSCIYTTKFTPSVNNTSPKVSGINLLVRSAKSDTGAESNKNQFVSLNNAEVKKVDGIGDSAFYNKAFMQLNILKGNNWYTLNTYKDTLSSSSLESNIAVANRLDLK